MKIKITNKVQYFTLLLNINIYVTLAYYIFILVEINYLNSNMYFTSCTFINQFEKGMFK
jgi:hypothetical protein